MPPLPNYSDDVTVFIQFNKDNSTNHLKDISPKEWQNVETFLRGQGVKEDIALQTKSEFGG
jgi:hypothetical protein